MSHCDGYGTETFKDIIRQEHRKRIEEGTDQTAGAIRLLRVYGLYSEFYEEKPHQLITIALPNDYDIEKMKKTILGLKYKYIINGKLCVENYSDNGKINLHIHILKEETYTKSKIIRDMASKFKVEPNFVDVATGRDQELYNTRLDYVLGTKTDKKMEDVEKNKIWRKENKIKDVYYINATQA